jgi:hypothetical protein
LIERMEHDQRAQFEWAAVEHRNTDHPHVHIVLRSIDKEGRELHFSRNYLGQVIRDHAQNICTAQIGPRTIEDVTRAMENEVKLYRLTSLDRAIAKDLGMGANQEAPHFDPLLGGHRAQFPTQPVLEARLRFLTTIGVTTQLGRADWLVPQNLDWQLKQMALAADRQRMLAQVGTAISDDKLPLRVTKATDIDALRGRVLGHVEDELTGIPVMILEGTDGQVHFIRHEARIQAARSRGKLTENHFISLDHAGVHDFGNADSYLASNRFRRTDPLPTELSASTHQWDGWLGRYLTGVSSNQRSRPVVENDRQIERDRLRCHDDIERD